MDSIHIDTGVKKILINGDENNFIEFNPEDILFAEHFYALVQDFRGRQGDFETRSAALEVEAKKKDGEADVPANIILIKEMCEYLQGQIDKLFGEGTSQKCFGGAMVLKAYEQFFTQITPFINSTRETKVVKYIPKVSVKSKSKRVVMK